MREHMLRVVSVFNTGKLIVKHGLMYSFSAPICDVNVCYTMCSVLAGKYVWVVVILVTTFTNPILVSVFTYKCITPLPLQILIRYCYFSASDRNMNLKVKLIVQNFHISI